MLTESNDGVVRYLVPGTVATFVVTSRAELETDWGIPAAKIGPDVTMFLAYELLGRWMARYNASGDAEELRLP